MGKKTLIIGGGPAGYVSALRAAQLGLDVVLIEQRDIGGTCLNRGCIPTKALLKSASVLREFQNAADFGLVAEDPYLDYTRVNQRKDRIVTKLRTGIGGLLKAAGVRVVAGSAQFVSDRELKVNSKDGSEILFTADSFIIATGSSPARPPILGIEDDMVITSDEMFSLEDVPEKLLIIGGGVIGVEMATVYASFGSEVIIVEMMDRLLPTFDGDISAEIGRELTRMGVELHLSCKVERFVRQNGIYAAVVMDKAGQQLTITAEKVLISIGRRANVKDLGLEVAGVIFDRVIPVDDHMRTNVPHIFAAGDVNGGIQLAHAASYEGIIAAENAAGLDAFVDCPCIPSCVYTFPEVASAGITEQEAAQNGIPIKIGRFPFSANSKAVIENEAHGFVKVVANAENDRIIGVHIVGPHATVLICEAVLAIEKHMTLKDLANTVHAHPTVEEAMQEAVLNANHLAIHTLN